MSTDGIADVLTPEMKLEELESRLALLDSDGKEKIIGSILDTQKTILPMRLLFNDFIQSMSNAGDLEGESPKENFMLMRNKVTKLSNELQGLSDGFCRLQPLFETIPEYSAKYGNKKYQPLETLKSSSNGTSLTNNATTVTANSNSNLNSINLATSNSKKSSRSNDGTPINISTPGSSTPTSAQGTKKPRKPRQTKKAISANSKTQTHPAALTGTPPTNSMGATPNTSAPMPGSLPPTNMMTSPINSMISPMAPTTFSGNPQSQPQMQPQSQISQVPQMSHVSQISQMPQMQQIQQGHQTQPQPQSQQQPQQQRQQRQFNAQQRNNAVSQSHLNMNNITPANILNMSMTQDAPNSQVQQPQQQQPQQQQQQNTNKDFDPLGFNNFDLWNLNMDMI